MTLEELRASAKSAWEYMEKLETENTQLKAQVAELLTPTDRPDTLRQIIQLAYDRGKNNQSLPMDTALSMAGSALNYEINK